MLGKKQTNKAKKASISSHPVFPAVVALWFAALLGLGSLVLPTVLFEKIFTATGISSLVTATQPPLGMTARMLIAVFAATVGAACGLFVARKVTNKEVPSRMLKPKPVADSAEIDSPAPKFKKPISAHEELGTDGLDAPLAIAGADPGSYRGKRRSLAVTDDSGPSDYLEHAPLPGGAMVFDESFGEVENQDDAPVIVEPLELAELALDDELTEESEEPEGHLLHLRNDAPAHVRPVPEPDPAENSALLAAMQTAVPTFGEPEPSAIDSTSHLREEFALNDSFGETSTSEVYNPFAAPARTAEEFKPAAPTSTARSFETQPFATQPVQAEPFQDQASMPVAFETTAPFGDAFSDQRDVSARPLSELGIVELVERFAAALQAKSVAEQTMAHAPVVAQELENDIALEPALAVEDAPGPLVFRRSNPSADTALTGTMAAPAVSTPSAFAPAAAAPEQAPPVAAPIFSSVPMALRPFDDDEDDGFDDDHGIDSLSGLSLSLSSAPKPFSQSVSFSVPSVAQVPASQPVAADEHDDEPDEFGAEDDSAYSSLLSMKSQFSSGQEFVRIEDDDNGASATEQVVVFPGHDQRRATPAADGPTRDPVMDRESESPITQRPFDQPGAGSQNEASNNRPPANPGETERALREALEKLQRMSGAA